MHNHVISLLKVKLNEHCVCVREREGDILSHSCPLGAERQADGSIQVPPRITYGPKRPKLVFVYAGQRIRLSPCVIAGS